MKKIRKYIYSEKFEKLSEKIATRVLMAGMAFFLLVVLAEFLTGFIEELTR